MKKKTIILVLTLLSGIVIRAQAPDLVPYGKPEQLELTPANILFFIVLPVLLFVAFFFIRRKKKNKKNT